MIRKDYHNFTLVEAMADADNAIGEFRMNRTHSHSTEDAEFIVGHGVIREELMELLRSYGLDPKPQLGNDGVIVCLIE